MAIAALVLCALIGWVSPGVAQTTGTSNPYAAPTDPAALEDLLNVHEKKLLQEGLIWLGFYNGWADGAFARGTRDAIWRWQQEN
ncbi:peptidoglycan-binding protein, partial [Streptomyces sp. 2MCAF27]